MTGEFWFPLTHGKWGVVDLSDADKASEYEWLAQRRNPDGTFYVVRYCRPVIGSRKVSCVSLHQTIMGKAPEGKMWDHKDGDGLNNRRYNLRLSTRGQNRQNSQKVKIGASKFKGVLRHRENWKACIKSKGINYHIGCFSTELEAAKAYDTKAKELFGEFARPNFPGS